MVPVDGGVIDRNAQRHRGSAGLLLELTSLKNWEEAIQRFEWQRCVTAKMNTRKAADIDQIWGLRCFRHWPWKRTEFSLVG